MSSLKQDVQFIFSKDCPAAKQSKIFSSVLTIAFWLILLIVFAVVPAGSKKEKYKTVQIVLSSPVNKTEKKAQAPAPQKPAAAPSQEAPAQTAAPAPVVEQPAAPAKVEQPAAKPKTAATKTEQKTPAKSAAKTVEQKPAATKAPEVVEYAADYSDGVDFSKVSPKKQASWDDVSFSDAASAQSSSSTEARTVTTKNEISGTAGTQGTANTSRTSAQSSSTASSSGVTSSVQNSLGQIADTKAVGDSKTTAGTSSVKALVDNGAFNWADGKARNMWYPASPDIKISPENSPGMQMDVEITFVVTDSGAVTDIQFVQSALLSESLKAEIRKQIAKWMFDEAAESSEARFLLKIRTK